MSTQPEALRLADSLDNYAEPHNCNEDAAAELRRLHTANVELLEALKLCAAVCAGHASSKSSLINALEKAREAMQKNGATS